MLLLKTFKDSDNEIKLIVTDTLTNNAIDFIDSGVTLMELYINNLVITSETDRVVFSNGGLVTFRLGDLTGLEYGRAYPIVLKVYDPSHLNGQILIHTAMEQTNTLFVIHDV